MRIDTEEPPPRRGLLEADDGELAVTGVHTAAVHDLPQHHRDPFFARPPVAQARSEGVTLLISDRMVATYGTPARLV
ncbi:PIN domain-containing protein [Nesterenkonia suensis]